MKPPHILIIHLNRFNFEENGIFKNETFIDYPLQDLDMQKFCFENK